MIRPLPIIKSVLGSLLVQSLVLRLMSWLVTPALPMIAGLFLLSAVVLLAVNGRSHR